ncbi:hypothetical protein AZE42_04938, partial [Rhizopogon vesiculosus]
NPWNTHITNSKEEAIQEHEQLADTIQVYSDGSGYKGQIGAAAILFRAGKAPRTLRYHLGTDEEHTVFEAEEVGLTIAAKLIATEPRLTFPLSILIDDQASIQAGESFYTRPGSYLVDRFRRMMQITARRHDNFEITVRWVPGHSDVHGNEEADKQAKLVAESRYNNSPPTELPHYLRHRALPLSISALKEVHRKATQVRWEHLWRKSPRYACMNRLDPELLQCSFIKLTASFPKRLTSLYMSLRTGHAPLNKHLHRIRIIESPHCPHCQRIEETVHLSCPFYQHERRTLLNALGRKASSISSPHRPQCHSTSCTIY